MCVGRRFIGLYSQMGEGGGWGGEGEGTAFLPFLLVTEQLSSASNRLTVVWEQLVNPFVGWPQQANCWQKIWVTFIVFGHPVWE